MGLVTAKAYREPVKDYYLSRVADPEDSKGYLFSCLTTVDRDKWVYATYGPSFDKRPLL